MARRAAGLMRSVRFTTLVEDEEALSARGAPSGPVIFGRVVLVRGLCAARARRPGSGAARAERAGGLRPARQGRLEDVQNVLLRVERHRSGHMGRTSVTVTPSVA